MKRPGWLGGQGGPDPGEKPGDAETLRAERARRERVRAQRRLASKAGEGEPGAKRKPAPKPKAAAKAKDEPEAKPKDRKPKDGAKPKDGPKPKDRDAKPIDRKPGDSKRKRGAAGKASPKRRQGVAASLKSGVGATRRGLDGVPTRLARGALRISAAIAAIFFDVIGFVLNVVFWIVGALTGPTRAVFAALGRFIRWASAQVTPPRALAAVVAGAAILLALSQFADYRSVTVGTDAYAEVETVAPAPEKERDETGSAHSYLMIPVAIGCLGLLGAAVAGRRWRLCRLIAGAGVVVVLVTLLVDRPAGLDTGDLEQAFDGVRATLLGGFYAQLFAGVVLIASSLMLGHELRQGAGERSARRSPGSARRLLKRPPKAQGARA